jgi:hypothetical protein
MAAAIGIHRNTNPLITQPHILVSQSLCQGEAEMAKNEAKTVVKINTLSFISSCLSFVFPQLRLSFCLKNPSLCPHFPFCSPAISFLLTRQAQQRAEVTTVNIHLVRYWAAK